MKRKETHETVRRVKEIHRRAKVPRVSVMVYCTVVHRTKRADRIFAKMRAGFELRDL